MQISQQLNRAEIFCRASFRERLAGGLVFSCVLVLFGFFWLAAANKIEIDRWVDPCGFKQKYGLPCPACGITTSAIAFSQGKVFEAFCIQPAGALLCCILVAVGFLAFLTAAFGVYFGFFKGFFAGVKIKYMLLAIIVIIAAGWVAALARALAAKSWR
jgi:hypothetical protein